MENKTIARTLRLLSQLMELHNENPFKVRSLANAAFKIDKLPYRIAKKTFAEIAAIDGIGESTAKKVWELIETQEIDELKELISKTPSGVLEIMSIKGIGPKKVKIIWEDLKIESVGELLYACNENRLIEAKGFGLKTQEEIIKAIEFKMASNGRFLYAYLEGFAEDLLASLKSSHPKAQISFTGEFRRKCEIIDSLDLLISESIDADEIKELTGLQITNLEDKAVLAETDFGLKVNIRFCEEQEFAYQLAMQTGNQQHIEELQKRLDGKGINARTETEIYRSAGLPFIEPELREGLSEFSWAEGNRLPKLIEFSDLIGTLHNHSTWSDGVHGLEAMAIFCRDELKLEYLGISDHSKSAFYAKGLTEDRVLAQIAEIDELNQKLAPFKIFKGIESDILYDGSLDYSSDILKEFDFVVASVHSILRMSEEKATERLIRAIENPYTTILGHPTGRMLLSRSGYPIDYKKVIDACAANKVVIEINSNPLRLDMDWRWHQYAMEKGVMLSVNPDAHRNEGFYDMRYGINVARKGGVSAKNCLNCLNLEEISAFFAQNRSSKTS
ncbi:MAG: hypothetical protein K0S09_304 [Sphingobacteriaceae bacterium]|jgi:DNA polymerase (family 10)|nr:hypothetical protein [Sphingobacteriaceae bacterium]